MQFLHQDACKHLPADRFEFDAIDAINSASFIPRFGSVMESVEMFEACVLNLRGRDGSHGSLQRCLLEAVLESNAQGSLQTAAARASHYSMAHFGVLLAHGSALCRSRTGTSFLDLLRVGGLLSVVCGRVSYMFAQDRRQC